MPYSINRTTVVVYIYHTRQISHLPQNELYTPTYSIENTVQLIFCHPFLGIFHIFLAFLVFCLDLIPAYFAHPANKKIVQVQFFSSVQRFVIQKMLFKSTHTIPSNIINQLVLDMLCGWLGLEIYMDGRYIDYFNLINQFYEKDD